MPQPDQVNRAANELIALYREAQESIIREALDTATSEPRRARLGELRRMVDAELATLSDATSDWLTSDLADVYAQGGAAAGGTGGGQFGWNQPHREAIQAMAGDAWDEVLAFHGAVSADARVWILSESRRQTALSLIEGRTAQQAARELARSASKITDGLGPIGVIQYADGSKRTMADYADMLLRTTTAKAYNAGTLNQLTQGGVGFVEVFDGADCGMTSHQDARKANGLVLPIREAYENPLSHPRCRRSFGGRPDVTSADKAKSAEPSTTVEQRADAAKFERDRAQGLADRRAQRVARERRKARSSQPKRRKQGAITRKARTPRKQAKPPATRSGPTPGMTSPTDRLTFTGKATAYQGLAADVGRIHGMPSDGLPDVTVKARKDPGTKGGHFSPGKRPPKPRRKKTETPAEYSKRYTDWFNSPTSMEILVIDRGDATQAVSFLHELGHRIDWDGQRFLTVSPAALAPAEASAVADFLQAAHATDTMLTARRRFPARYASYYRDDREVWARAYSQWAANKLGGAPRAALEASHAVAPGFQWPDDEFGILGPLVEGVLRARGLML